MDKNIIYKYFMNQASPQEIDKIIEWVEKSDANRDFFAQQKALWDISENIKKETKPKTSDKQNRNLLIRTIYFSAAAVLIILLTINLFIMAEGQSSAKEDYLYSLSALPAEKVRSIYTEKGVKAQVILPDSSIVWLNSDSKITYPAVFNKKVRNVELSGEAYFEVTKDSLCPMIVKTNKDFSIEVLGTSFSVKSYDNDNIAKATLFSGSISMHYKDNKSKELRILKLKPEESFVYYQESTTPKQVKYKNNEKEIAWKNGELLFEQTPIEEVIKVLERWHGTKFIIENKEIFNDKLTASFQTESIVQIMEMMKYCIEMNYSINNNTVTITK